MSYRILIASFLNLLVVVPAPAAIVTFTDKAVWEAAVSGEQEFDFTAANVLLANQVSSLPPANTNVGNTLTFEAANTGLSADFTFHTLQSGANFTFDDHEAAGNLPDFDNALSVGDIDNFENDDWEMTFSPGLFALGFDLRNSIKRQFDKGEKA